MNSEKSSTESRVEYRARRIREARDHHAKWAMLREVCPENHCEDCILGGVLWEYDQAAQRLQRAKRAAENPTTCGESNCHDSRHQIRRRR